MLSEQDLRQQMHDALDPLLAPIQPRDMVGAIRRRQQRRTQLFAGVAAAISVLAITTPLVVGALDDRRPSRPTGTPSPAASATADIDVLVPTGECAGLAVALSRPGQPADWASTLRPAPAVNHAVMNYADTRYIEAQGPCAERLRMHTEGPYLAGSIPKADEYVGDTGATFISISKDSMGSQRVELFLDCPGGDGMQPCPGVPQPLAVILVEVGPSPEHMGRPSAQSSTS